MRKTIKKHWGILVILLFSIIPLLPLFHSGFFPMHDDTQVARVFEMGNALRDGMVPVRWSQDLGYGYGYPLFTFYAPLAFYFGGMWTLFGISALFATKLMMGVGIILSGIFMYFFARDIWGEVGGTLAGLCYLYAPYHALDIYVRGDVAEYWAYAFVPLAFWGLWKIYQTQKIQYTSLGALGLAGIILSHNLTALMVVPFLMVFMLFLLYFSKSKKATIYYLLTTIVLGLGLSAFYWLPVPFEMHYTNVLSQIGGGADFHKNFVCLTQLWNSPWGYGGSIPGCIDGISFALGKVYILFLILSIFASIFIFKKDKKRGALLLGSILGVSISLFLLLPWSESVWNILHVLAFLQYPWRFLLVVFFFLSFLSGAVFWLIEQTKVKKNIYGSLILFVVSVGALVAIQGKYFTPQKYIAVNSDFYTNTSALQWNVSNITNEYMPKGFQKPEKQETSLERFVLPAKSGIISSQSETTQEKIANVALPYAALVPIALAYFPGWHAYIDGKEARITVLQAGMALFIRQGKHTIALRYKSTFVELLGNSITLLSIAIIILVIIYNGKRKGHEKNS